MHILITGADCPLGQLTAKHFGPVHHVRAVGRGNGPREDGAYIRADLREPEVVAPLLEGVDAVFHLDVFDPADALSEKECLDCASRGTYVLLHEARKAGVERVVLVSPLSLMAAYPEDHVVDESWKPLPEPDAPSLSPYLAELACREFAREEGIFSICLRFGILGEDTSESIALKALEGALSMPVEAKGYRWQVFHVTSGGRFETRSALKALHLESKGD